MGGGGINISINNLNRILIEGRNASKAPRIGVAVNKRFQNEDGRMFLFFCSLMSLSELMKKWTDFDYSKVLYPFVSLRSVKMHSSEEQIFI